MILLDAPAWPAHGTLWGHLVSDSSLEELHVFARTAGLPSRGFDHDHYDFPLSRRDELVALGAMPVESTELMRRLRAAGLRVRPVHKTPSRAAASARLRQAWEALLPGREALRDELLERNSEPHRHYHDVRHVASVVDSLAALGCSDQVVHLAAWFHDAVYAGVPGQDEEDSAALASARLAGVLPRRDVAEVVRLVLLTAGHDPASRDVAGAHLVDADLSILGAVPGRYHVYVRDVRLEYGHLDEPTFTAGRARVLNRLLELDPLFRTPTGARLWADAARENLVHELDALGR